MIEEINRDDKVYVLVEVCIDNKWSLGKSIIERSSDIIMKLLSNRDYQCITVKTKDILYYFFQSKKFADEYLIGYEEEKNDILKDKAKKNGKA